MNYLPTDRSSHFRPQACWPALLVRMVLVDWVFFEAQNSIAVEASAPPRSFQIQTDKTNAASSCVLLKTAGFAQYIERFNAMASEAITNAIPDAQAWDWLQNEIPFFECPDQVVEEMYYFRWWSFRKHLVRTPQGYIITEFLPPVKHAGLYNTISCAAGFHLAEGRWLHDDIWLDDYARFWFQGNNGHPQPHFHKFSSWLTAAVYERYLVNGNPALLTNLLPSFVADYHLWETERQLTNGLFWQYDVRDGMEESISGSRTSKNLRPTFNCYMFANAKAIAATARLAGQGPLANEFMSKAAQLSKQVCETLWDTNANFFEVRQENGTLAGVREELGFIPWMFHLPSAKKNYDAAWLQLKHPMGFSASAGLVTAERRHPQFRTHGVGSCEWDGAVWPFATSQTLYAFANLLRDYPHLILTPRDYFDAFLTYVHSQHVDGQPYVGEYLDEVTGNWINGKNDRSRYYNHSTFADLLITGVVGLRPRADRTVEVFPLLPDRVWDYFCLDGVHYHGHILTIIWDESGTRYGHGVGFTLMVDGRAMAHASQLSKITAKLP